MLFYLESDAVGVSTPEFYLFLRDLIDLEVLCPLLCFNPQMCYILMVNRLGEVGKLLALKLSVRGAPNILQFAQASIFLLDADYSELELLLFSTFYLPLLLTGVRFSLPIYPQFSSLYLLCFYKYQASDIFCLLIISMLPESNIPLLSAQLISEPTSVFMDYRLGSFFYSWS